MDCKEIQPVHSEGDQPWDFFGRNDAKAETPVLWPPDAKSWLIGKDSDAGRDWGQEEKGTTEDEMAGWHHWFDGREPEWTPGVGDGQGGLACCDSWGRKESDTTERLIWSEDRSQQPYLALRTPVKHDTLLVWRSRWPCSEWLQPVYKLCFICGSPLNCRCTGQILAKGKIELRFELPLRQNFSLESNQVNFLQKKKENQYSSEECNRILSITFTTPWMHWKNCWCWHTKNQKNIIQFLREKIVNWY